MNTTFIIKGSYPESDVIAELFDGMVNADITAHSSRVTVRVHHSQVATADAILKDAGFI